MFVPTAVLFDEKLGLNITHLGYKKDLKVCVDEVKKNIIDRGPVCGFSIKEQLDLVDDMATFPLGRFFLQNRGANGFWTDYIINYPNAHERLNINSEGKPLSKVEEFILKKTPLALAHRDRFNIFQQQMQNLLKDDISIMSVPCGCMRDILTLDYRGLKNYRLVGVDIDEESLEYASKLAISLELQHHTDFFQRDAWQLNMIEEFDLITSNGLNIYVQQKKKLIELYRQFYQALKPGGTLVIGVLSPLPSSDKQCDWNLNLIPEKDILMEEVLFKHILEAGWWHSFSTWDEIQSEFREAGFTKLEIIHDRYRIYPTVIATK